MGNDLTHQYQLLTAILNEIEYINNSVRQDITVKELRNLIEIRFKTNLTQLLFPKPGGKDISFNIKLEESDLKYIRDYFVQLSTIPPSLHEFTCRFLSKTNNNLPKDKIDQQIKLINAKKSEMMIFISQVYLLKKEELYDKLNTLQEFENQLNRTRKAYKTEADLKKLKEFEDRNAEMNLNYNRHMAYLNLCEQGMKQVTESCFNLAISILLKRELTQDSNLS